VERDELNADATLSAILLGKIETGKDATRAEHRRMRAMLDRVA
jgi:hypothetical protein